MQERDRFCPACGKTFRPPGAGPPAPASRGKDLGQHLHILGILWIVYSVVHLIPGGFLATMPMGGFWTRDIGLHRAFFPGVFLGMFGLVLLVVCALGIVVGVGLLHRRPWARMMAIIFACLALLNFPFGTILGVYTLWALASSDAERQFRQLAG